MNLVHRAATRFFDLLLAPLAGLGPEFSIVLLSGLFGILALLLFKQISWQKGIKGTKDKIKAGLIEIRIYQNDLGIVAQAVGKVLGRNLQYMALNFGPILPLFVPFTLVAAQLVCRFGFSPVPLWKENEAWLPGRGTVVEVAMQRGQEARIGELKLELPPFLELKQPLIQNSSAGKAWFEVVATQSGAGEFGLSLGDGIRTTKQIVTGAANPPDLMAPERVHSFWKSWLWPAEPTLKGTPFESVVFVYPERELRYMPDGPLGVLIAFFVASILFGILILKPLGIEI